jgi:hypothetical protein
MLSSAFVAADILAAAGAVELELDTRTGERAAPVRLAARIGEMAAAVAIDEASKERLMEKNITEYVGIK